PTNGIKPVPLDDVLNLPDAMDRRMALEVLAEDTGGFASGTHSNDYAAAFDRIVEENSSYYLLGYTPANPQPDGKFHKTRVEITRPGRRVGVFGDAFHVRMRSGYTAEKSLPLPNSPSDVPASLADLVKSPISISGLALMVTAIPFRQDGAKGTLAIVV